MFSTITSLPQAQSLRAHGVRANACMLQHASQHPPVPVIPKDCMESSKHHSAPLPMGAGTHGPPVLLIHGFGASAYHWRYNIPFLAKNHRVYAIDLLGRRSSPAALGTCYGGYTPLESAHSRRLRTWQDDVGWRPAQDFEFGRIGVKIQSRGQTKTWP